MLRRVASTLKNPNSKSARRLVPEKRPVVALTRPLTIFAENPASSGIVLLAAALAALIWANSPWWQSYVGLWDIRIGLGYQGSEVFRPLSFWIDDGLMTVFFLLVGLEIKREVTVGDLASPRRAALPIAAALGGVLVPALIYSLFNLGRPSQDGWGIPMATDIAFVAGMLAILGSRIPSSLAVFLTALAIVDDLVAVVVIALFYTARLNRQAMLLAAGIVFILWVMNRLGVTDPLAYALPGVLLWVCVLESGIHATISGVLLAMMIPGRRFLDQREFVERGRKLLNAFENTPVSGDQCEEIVEHLEAACRHVEPPLHRMERALRPWVSLVIMPLFAFANAGVRITGSEARGFGNPVTLGVLLGLFLGKPCGILLFSAISTRAGIAVRPDGVSWAHIHGAGWLAGIGFTMSLFVGGLAFGHSAYLDDAKMGIFSASILAGITGSILLAAPRRGTTKPA